jgi:hypothetical protein
VGAFASRFFFLAASKTDRTFTHQLINFTGIIKPHRQATAAQASIAAPNTYSATAYGFGHGAPIAAIISLELDLFGVSSSRRQKQAKGK